MKLDANSLIKQVGRGDAQDLVNAGYLNIDPITGEVHTISHPGTWSYWAGAIWDRLVWEKA